VASNHLKVFSKSQHTEGEIRMPQLSRRTFIEIASLAGAGLLGGCGGVAGMTAPDDFPVLVFSDVHFQPLIPPFPPSAPATTFAVNTALVAQLDAADTSAWPAIFQGAGNTANNTPSAAGTDTNYALLALTLASIKQNLGTTPAVLFTGDFLGHGLDQLYSVYSVNKTSAEAAAFVDKTLTFVLQQIRAAVGAIPVYFALGNCDSYNGYGPDSTFLANNAQQLYTLALNGAANQQDVISSLTNGGYYSAEPAGMDLKIIGLNTIALSPLVGANPTLIAAQFAWFDAQLAAASAAGQKVWLLMHAPPGADEGTTGQPPNDNGQIATATMMWTGANQTTFMGIIEKYPGVIAMSLAGHTHMDEFRLMSPGNTLAITAGISPCFGNNPAYKIFTLDSFSLAPTDYSAVNCNLQATPAQFNDYYTFSQAYNLEGPLATSLAELFPTLLASTAAQQQYQGAFHSGNNASNTANPITSTNWPVYWCGIGFMDQQEFLTAVNAF
jgi:3',5'-cyclic AMP phosphodiesterase CpdA